MELTNGVYWQEWCLFEKTQAKTSRMILNSMNASSARFWVRGLLTHLLVRLCLCFCQPNYELEIFLYFHLIFFNCVQRFCDRFWVGTGDRD